MIEIIKKGNPNKPYEKSYVCKCKYCNTIFKFTTEDFKRCTTTMFENKYAVECPVCLLPIQRGDNNIREEEW